MAYDWKSIDGNFPVFTGKESPSQQIRALHDYLFQMREALQFSLSNLSADNFNAEELKNLSDSQKGAFAEELAKIAALFSTLSGEVGRLRGSIQDTTKLSNRIGDLEKDVTGEGGLREKVFALDETVNGEDGLNARVTSLNDAVAGEKGLQEQLKNISETVFGEDGLLASVSMLEEAVLGENGMIIMLDRINGAMKVQDDESVTLGAEGKRIDLVGDIYINGVLYAQGETQ